ncbi:MAG: short-chain dehydrogenase/reductase [Bacteroidetes bacterium]|nr:short-chain dehydrogenase/reductase [Bacteroidota bacterium]
MKIEGKHIVVTGASSGIGKSLVEFLSAYERVKIVAAARRSELIPKKEGIIFAISLDVSTQKGVDELFSFALQKLGHIDIFIANAGFTYTERLIKPDWGHISDIFSLNVFSPIYSLEKLMAAEGERQIQFVTLISGVAYFPLPAYALYCSTKGALRLFFEAYRFEKNDNLIVSNVYPVATRTEFFEKAALGSVSLPFLSQDQETVARGIINGIERDKRNIYPSLLFRLFLPVARAFPFLIKAYSLNEKRKVSDILKS